MHGSDRADVDQHTWRLAHRRGAQIVVKPEQPLRLSDGRFC